MVLSDLFTTFAAFQDVVPSVGASITLKELEPSATSAKKQICAIITEAIYASILAGSIAAQKTALSLAVANATMAKQVSFEAVKYRKREIAVYKSEQDSMRRSFNENYHNAMDTLLQLLDTAGSDGWKATAFYTMKETMKIKTADEFNALYPIDGSYLFFYRTLPFQAEIIDEELKPYFDKAEEKNDADCTRRLNRALAQLVVVAAIQQFDPVELPTTIRNLFEESTSSRNGDGEQSRLLDLARQLLGKATETIKSVDLVLHSDSSVSADVVTNFNLPEDKIYLM